MQIGDVIAGRFVLERRAGVGGMGVVFRALDNVSGTPAAIKLVVGSASELDRFAREVALLAQLDHPRVVRYLGHGEAGEARYLAMEWLEGEDLAHRLTRGPLPLADALAVLRGVAEALVAVHAHGVVHRDIKPGNVFLHAGDCGDVKLLDLGVARTRELAWNLTGTGVAIGTPAYMAPEQARGEPVDARSDLFSLGCLVFECMSGRSPFHADHPIAAFARMLVEDAPRLADIGITAPPALEALLAALLAKDPAARPVDARAVLLALDAWSGRMPPAHGPAPAITGAEQRIVTLVLTRPATDSSQTLLPQESGDLERRVRAIAATHRARLERLPNGSFLAFFTGAGAPTDHAARAAAFALALPAHLGADTIALATGRGLLSDRLPIGAVIDRAVDLLAHGGAGVRLDGVTAALLAGRFEIAGAGDRQQLLGLRDEHTPRRTLLGRATACVGRGRELATLTAALAACMEESVAAATLITAPPGLGKSRLVDEFIRSVRGRDDLACLLVGRCDVMSAGSAFGAIASALRRLVRGDPDHDPRAALLTRLRSRLPADERAWIGELLGELCGVWTDHDISPNLRRLRGDPILLGDALAAAWRSFLAAEAQHGAIVLVLEDLHWGDLPSLRLVDSALRVLCDHPIFVIATGRPELHDLFPRLWAERGVHELRLGHLPPRTAEQLARQVLGTSVDAPTIAQIVERAGGHPFLLEELIRAVAAGAPITGDVPDTVLGMLQSRFDALPEDARAVLRAASVFGVSFWPAGVEALLTAPIADALERLCAAELLERRSDTRLPGQLEYAFRHGLVRDAAHATLTDADRRTGHRLAGAWLVDAGERDPLVLAEHFDRGGEPVPAARWYQAAAAEALEGNDLTGAIRLAERAEVSAIVGDGSALLPAVELVLADAWYWRGDMASAAAYALRAASRLEPGSDPWFTAVSAVIQSCGQQGVNDEVERWLARAADITRDQPSDAQLICLARGISQLSYVSLARVAPFKARLDAVAALAEPGPLALGWLARVQAETTPYYRSRVESAALFRSARAHFEAAGALRHACLMHIIQCRTLSHSGHPREAMHELGLVHDETDRLGVPYLTLFANLEEGVARFYADDDPGCIAAVQDHIAATRGSNRIEALMRLHLALAHFALGQFDATIALAREVLAAPLAAALLHAAHALHARALLRLDRPDDARRACEHALALRPACQPDIFDDVATIALAEVLLAHDDEPRARELVALAWHNIAALPLAPAARTLYLRRRVVRELAALARQFGLPPQPT